MTTSSPRPAPPERPVATAPSAYASVGDVVTQHEDESSALSLRGAQGSVATVVGNRLSDVLGGSGKPREFVDGQPESHDLTARVVEAGPAGPWVHGWNYSGHRKSLTTPTYEATVSRVGNAPGATAGEVMANVYTWGHATDCVIHDRPGRCSCFEWQAAMEPKARGARVRDKDGCVWKRGNTRWTCTTPVDGVRVLSVGRLPWSFLLFEYGPLTEVPDA